MLKFLRASNWYLRADKLAGRGRAQEDGFWRHVSTLTYSRLTQIRIASSWSSFAPDIWGRPQGSTLPLEFKIAKL